MRLKQFTYSEPGWSLKNLYFREVGLIVGKNAVGKSKSIRALNQFASVILQQKEIEEYHSFGYNVVFYDDDLELTYELVYQDGNVIIENLKDNHGKTYINRDENSTIFFGQSINPPSNRLTLNVRRDTILYPEIEKIIKWAENSYGLLFNEIKPEIKNTSSFNIMSLCENLISMFEKLDDSARNEIREELNNLNYLIDKLEITEIDQQFKVLHIEENKVRKFLWEGSLSQGMQRALFLLVFIHFIATQKDNARTIVIDDFCEGLDYDRTIKLGKYVYNFCINNKVQLITTSNDSFLMDIVDLKYWNILQRDGENVTAINANNTPDLFDEFEFTGLSNFDLFSSDFIARHKK